MSAVSESMAFLRRIRELEDDKAAMAGRYLQLEKAYDRLSDEYDTYRKANPPTRGAAVVAETDYVPFNVFRNTCIETLGKDHGYQARFMEQTQTTEAEMRRWVKNGEVPYTAYEMALRLTPVNEPLRAGWTTEQRARLMQIWNQTPRPTLKEVAAILTKEFKRNITANSIRGQIYNRKES